jgi:Undecaprenyl-phosphate glucose phosphotransferase
LSAAERDVQARNAARLRRLSAVNRVADQNRESMSGNRPQAALALGNFEFNPAQPGPATLVRMAIDPFVAIGSLLMCALVLGVPFTGPYVILSMLVFSLTFPGSRSLNMQGSAELGSYIASNWLLITGLLFLLGWSSQTLYAFDQRVLMAWVVITPFALFVAHWLAPGILKRALSADDVQRRAVIIGANEMGRRLATRIRENPFLGIHVDGYFDDRNVDRLKGIADGELLGKLDALPDYVREHKIDVIYGSLPAHSQPRMRALFDELHDTTASLYLVPDLLPFDMIQAKVDIVSGIPVLAVCETPYQGLNRLVKRLSDLVIASAILLLIAPLMLLIALGVKLSSPGPVLFKQRRYGLDGREILVYKFRTMTCMEDGDEIRQATEDDPRTTRFGRFLRRYSLDELPQFINVLQGRMSVVGPRPHAVAHNEMYRKLIRGYMIRHKVTPGITGLAQVQGLRGETETLDKMRERIESDLEYLRNWSLLFDLQIILRTIGVVAGRKNAC